MNWILVTLASFVVGSIPFSFLLVRLRTGDDLRRAGSGNPGATNALRIAGPSVAGLGLAFDIAKGFVPVWLGRAGGLPDETLAASAVACVLGHVFSPLLGFRGGKGVATGSGALSALYPLAVGLGLVVFLGVLAVSRIVSLSSMVAVAALPFFWLLPEPLGPGPAAGRMGWVAAILICALILLRHGENVRRLKAGTESRLGVGSK